MAELNPIFTAPFYCGAGCIFVLRVSRFPGYKRKKWNDERGKMKKRRNMLSFFEYLW